MKFDNYTFLRELSPKAFLAEDKSGRKVVLKLLPQDCLLEGQLNPNIAERLRRVREIAMTDVANLRGVEREADRVFLVWDYVEGDPFDAHASEHLAHELVHSVAQFHATGLVHGAIHSGNVLVDPSGRIKLIDVSPLLFLDPARDERAVQQMCGELLWANVTSEVAKPRSTLRRRTLLAALIVLVIGASVAVKIDRMVRRSHPAPLTPPRVSR